MKDQTLAHIGSDSGVRRSNHMENSAGESSSAESIRSVVVAATFTADLLRHPLTFWMDRLDIGVNISMAPYMQVMQELLNPESLLCRNRNGFNILLIRLEDWIHDRGLEDNFEYLEYVGGVKQELLAAARVMRGFTSTPMLVFFCPSSSSLPNTYREPLEEAQRDLMVQLSSLAQVDCWDHADLIRLYPVAEHEDAHADRLGRIPYSTEYFVAIATLLARRISAILRPPHKVIVVDCDNTLWKGICGEDGVDGIEFTPGHIDFHRTLIRQHDEGMLLCLCTKNNADDVEAVFNGRADMLLQAENFVSQRVNWNSKSGNIQSLAQELDLALDSFIFIDDNPLECAEVRAHCPSVLVLQFPEKQEDIAHFLNHVWVFDRVEVSQEAKQRTTKYKQNRQRHIAFKEAANLDQFLASLELKVEIATMRAEQLTRVAELIQRTNQFNFTGLRRRSSEIETLCNSGAMQVLVVQVRDRFGDYGLVGALLLRREESRMEVDTFVLSCRALGRGVERCIVNELGRMARDEGRSHLVLKFRRTARNAPAWKFLEKSFIQFRMTSESDGASATDEVFEVPSEYAAGLDHQFLPGVSEEGEEVERNASGIATPATSYTQKHEVAWRLSHLARIMEEMKHAVPRGPSASTEYVAPRTAIETAVAEIWAAILGVEKVGIRSDFIDIGGDSILAVQVLSRIESTMNRELSVHEFFEEPTVEKVAAKLAGTSTSDSRIQHVDVSGRVPLSWAQQRLWFIDQLEGDSAAYHVHVALRFWGDLDLTALHGALDSLIARHEALRTVFISVNGEPMQQVAPAMSFVLPVIELISADAGEREAEVAKQSLAELAVRFDLSTGPLIRGRLLRLSKDDHVLLMTLHHIVSDGWSIGVLIRELGALYEAFHIGGQSPLQPLSIQYSDYVRWQRQLLSGSLFQEHLRFWKEHLYGAPELLELPRDRPRPAIQSYQGGNASVLLGEGLSADLKVLTRRFNATPAMFLFTAWSIVLSKLSGQDDIVVGIPIANRRRTEVEALIGCFVNTLAVRVRLEDDPPVSDLLQRVKQGMLGAYAHQDIPFEKVVESLQPSRSLSHNPIFQVMLAFQSASGAVVQLPGVTLTEQEMPLPKAQFDLLLTLRETDQGISGTLNYATDLFDAATAERWAGYFMNVISEMVRAPGRQVSKLSLMAEDEYLRVTRSFNATTQVYAEKKLIHELFEEQVERTPEAVAVIYENESLTYSELNAKANQLAWYLRDKGVGPDQLVAICVERSLEMLVGLLGILKAGGAYVPLDPGYPHDRLQYMLENASPKVLLTQQKLKSRFASMAVQVTSLESEWGEVACRHDTNPDPRSFGLTSRHLAYVIYTSGSTGRPKGAMNEHRALINRLQWMQNQYQLDGSDRVLQKTPFSFDVSVWEFFWTLMSGARLIVARPQGHQDPAYLRAVIEATGVTTLHFVPSMLQIFLDQYRDGQCPTIRHIVCSGEELPPALQDKCLHNLPKARLSNLYGPTEAAIDVTAWECRSGERNSRIPIGCPIWNVQMYVLDRYGQPVPIGVTGEIFIAGVGVGRGYLNQPELTKERFIVDPFGATPDARMYKTGDQGRWREDGAIEYLGRNDNQVKIRGLRIELGEIEEHLARHAHVREAVVVAREEGQGEKRLVAYVTGLGNIVATAAELRMHLKATLPEFMVPSAFVILDSLPLSPNGKLDRKALPPPGPGIYASRQYEIPQGEVEEGLAAIWQQLLHLDRIGRKDTFFELGGHSLLAIKALSKINESFGSALTVTDIYKNPTIENLAAFIRGSTAEDPLVDLSQEAMLEDHIRAQPGIRAVPADAVMLTGATGFVGRFLLAQLLQDTDATIYCLTRARSESQAVARVRSTLSKWDLWRDEFEGRIIGIPGDLGLPDLGLNEATYRSLSQRIGTIYHCGTSMNHLETYAMAKPANVGGAKELLKLASNTRPKVINHISTLNVFRPLAGGKSRTVDELTTIDHEEHRSSKGYDASKWVSEKLFMIAAAERQIPCNIFRLGLIWADMRQGRYDELQNAYRVLKSSLLSGYGIQDYRYEMVPTPVDYAVRAIVFLANTHVDGHGMFHISSSRQAIKDVFGRCNEIAGTSLELVSHYDWICKIKQLHRQGISLPIVPLVEGMFSMDQKTFYEHQRATLSASLRFECGRTHQELDKVGITAPVFDDDILRVCVESMFARDPELRVLLMESGESKFRLG